MDLAIFLKLASPSTLASFIADLDRDIEIGDSSGESADRIYDLQQALIAELSANVGEGEARDMIAEASIGI